MMDGKSQKELTKAIAAASMMLRDGNSIAAQMELMDVLPDADWIDGYCENCGDTSLGTIDSRLYCSVCYRLYVPEGE